MTIARLTTTALACVLTALIATTTACASPASAAAAPASRGDAGASSPALRIQQIDRVIQRLDGHTYVSHVDVWMDGRLDVPHVRFAKDTDGSGFQMIHGRVGYPDTFAKEFVVDANAGTFRATDKGGEWVTTLSALSDTELHVTWQHVSAPAGTVAGGFRLEILPDGRLLERAERHAPVTHTRVDDDLIASRLAGVHARREALEAEARRLEAQTSMVESARSKAPAPGNPAYALRGTYDPAREPANDRALTVGQIGAREQALRDAGGSKGVRTDG